MHRKYFCSYFQVTLFFIENCLDLLDTLVRIV